MLDKVDLRAIANAKLPELKRKADIEKRRRNLLHFTKATHRRYKAGWVHKDICRRLERFSEQVARGESPRLMLTLPPRHGKSFLASERFPTWHIGKHNDHKIVVGSYSLTAARKRSRPARSILKSDVYRETFPDVRLDPAMSAVDEWGVDGYEASYYAVGVSGSLTGDGADILIIDDPVKGWEEANSKTIRDKTWDWYRSDAYTRLGPGGGVLVIQTRWHKDDLAGRLLEAEKKGEGDTWEVVNYPAIAEEDEEHRKRGEALHEERWPLKYLKKIRGVLGSYIFNALYQGRPSSKEGGIWKRDWFGFWTTMPLTEEEERSGRYIRLPEEFDEELWSWDMTFGSQSDSASQCCGHRMARRGADKYLLEEVRGKWLYPEMRRQMKDAHKRQPQATRHLVENKALGPALIQETKREVPGLLAVEPKGDKKTRAIAVSGDIEGGNFWIPDPRMPGYAWAEEALDEYADFPTGKYNDRVDTDSQGLLHLNRARGLWIG